jgi:hypothetical protein
MLIDGVDVPRGLIVLEDSDAGERSWLWLVRHYEFCQGCGRGCGGASASSAPDPGFPCVDKKRSKENARLQCMESRVGIFDWR